MERVDTVELDVSGIKTATQLHELLKNQLRFPSWYGCNWDAFWDSITGFVEMPKTLKLIGWALLEANLPSDAALMKRCLNEMELKFPALAATVVYQ